MTNKENKYMKGCLKMIKIYDRTNFYHCIFVLTKNRIMFAGAILNNFEEFNSCFLNLCTGLGLRF